MRFAVFLLLMFFLLTATSVSALNYRKYEKTVMRENNIRRHTLLTIESPDGDLIDCVDIRKQPAFDHPLLRNHKILKVPAPWLKEKKDKLKDDVKEVSQIWLESGTRCPKDSIPIQRSIFDKVMRDNSVSKFRKKQYSLPHELDATHNPVHEYAVAVNNNGLKKVYGTKATISVWQPSVEENEEFSLAQIWLVSKQAKDVNTLEVGWHVFPELYNNTKRPRLFIYWTADGYIKTGCYNLFCPGFVQTNNEVLLGGSFRSSSSSDGVQYLMNVLVRKDQKNDAWWLMYNGVDLGYWPMVIVTRLKEGAATAEWGGEILNMRAHGKHTSTQMGSGKISEKGFRKASYFENLQIVTVDDCLIPVQSVSTLTGNQNCYNITVNPSKGKCGIGFSYGGPGYSSRCK